MTEYRVTWTFDTEAADATEAALRARAAQVRPGTIATYFQVASVSTWLDSAEHTDVDLTELEDDRAELVARYGRCAAEAFPDADALSVVLSAADSYADYLADLEYGDPDDGDIDTDAAERNRVLSAVAALTGTEPSATERAAAEPSAAEPSAGMSVWSVYVDSSRGSCSHAVSAPTELAARAAVLADHGHPADADVTAAHRLLDSCCDHPLAPLHCAHDDRDTDACPFHEGDSRDPLACHCATDTESTDTDGALSVPDALATVLAAAEDWRRELVDYVIPAADPTTEKDQEDSTAANYGRTADRIADATALLEAEHVGHFSRIGGTWWCDTCNSPLCERADADDDDDQDIDDDQDTVGCSCGMADYGAPGHDGHDDDDQDIDDDIRTERFARIDDDIRTERFADLARAARTMRDRLDDGAAPDLPVDDLRAADALVSAADRALVGSGVTERVTESEELSMLVRWLPDAVVVDGVRLAASDIGEDCYRTLCDALDTVAELRTLG